MADNGPETRTASPRPKAPGGDRHRPASGGLVHQARRRLSGFRRFGGRVLAAAGLRPARPRASMSTEYFEALYAADPDPWNFTDSGNEYEARKYAATLAALPRPNYAAALEVGCSIGVLTAELAPRCGSLLSIDAAAAPLAAARERTAGFPQVKVRQARVPEDWPEGRFELILISEVLYFFTPEDLRRLAERAAAALVPGGDIVLVHWTGPSEFPLTGDAAVEGFRAALGGAAAPLRQERAEQWRLDVLRRTVDGSPAAAAARP